MIKIFYILWIIVLGIYFLIIRLKNIVLIPIVSRLMIAVMIGSCIYLTLEYTYLRDGLYPWNGRIFDKSLKAAHQMK